MKKHLSLRRRILLAMVFVVTATSFIFGIGLLHIKSKLEEATFGKMLDEQLQIVANHHAEGDIIPEEFIGGWQFFASESDPDLPETFKSLPVGTHHSISIDDKFYQVRVADWRGEKVWLSYDISYWEQQEHDILGLLVQGALVVLVAAILMGIYASRAILAPVKALTQRLQAIRPQDRNVRIAGEFDTGEVNTIAVAFDSYQQRIDTFVEREQSFSTAASHELRTPLSIIIGASDILETQSLSEPGQRALARIQRACRDMLAFIEVALFLSRENAQPISDGKAASLHSIIEELVSESTELANAQHNRIKVFASTDSTIAKPRSLIKVAIGNMLRNALEHTTNGNVTIKLESDLITISDDGEGIDPENLTLVTERGFSTKQSGAGMGLDIVKRICVKCGWEFTIHSEVRRGTAVSINFREKQ